MARLKAFWAKIKFEIIFRLLWLISTGIALSLRTRIVGGDRLDAMINSGEGGVMATWHGTTMLPIYYCRHKGLWAIISKSRDGELQNRLVASRGFSTIRGSSGSQGVRAFLEAAKRIRKEGALVSITPDGPKGPAKVVQLGTILLAERGRCKILPVGVACSRSWRIGSWDRHMIPKPFGRAAIYFGEPIQITESESDDERHLWAKKLEEAISFANSEAERLVTGDIK